MDSGAVCVPLILCLFSHLCIPSRFVGNLATPGSANLPEPAWHRNQRRQRSRARKALKLFKAAERLDNHHGSCSGFFVEMGKKWNNNKPWVPCSGCQDGSCNSWLYENRLSKVGPCCTTCGKEWLSRGSTVSWKSGAPWNRGQGAGSGQKPKPADDTKNSTDVQKAKKRIEDDIWQRAQDDPEMMRDFKASYPNSEHLKPAPAELPLHHAIRVASAEWSQAVKKRQNDLATYDRESEKLTKRKESLLEQTCNVKKLKTRMDKLIAQQEEEALHGKKPDESFLLDSSMIEGLRDNGPIMELWECVQKARADMAKLQDQLKEAIDTEKPKAKAAVTVEADDKKDEAPAAASSPAAGAMDTEAEAPSGGVTKRTCSPSPAALEEECAANRIKLLDEQLEEEAAGRQGPDTTGAG